MRLLSKIKADLLEVEEQYKVAKNSLNKEIELFQNACPHPSKMLSVDVHDYDDGGYGVPRYDYSVMTVTCLCCEKTRYSPPLRSG